MHSKLGTAIGGRPAPTPPKQREDDIIYLDLGRRRRMRERTSVSTGWAEDRGGRRVQAAAGAAGSSCVVQSGSGPLAPVRRRGQCWCSHRRHPERDDRGEIAVPEARSPAPQNAALELKPPARLIAVANDRRAGPVPTDKPVAWRGFVYCAAISHLQQRDLSAMRVCTWARDPRAHARPIVRAARPIKGPAPVCTPTWPGSHQIARQRTAAPAGSACVRILRETKGRQRH